MKPALALLVLAAAAGVSAQAETADPIRCWWRTGTGAVTTGEPFAATLTCAAREQESVRTVPDESRLPAATIQLAPFEVLGGSHPSDLRSSTHRFFQYHYSLRIIDRDTIGRDTRFPDLQIAYRVHTKVNGEWVEGRDRIYVIPGQPVRVLSLVPVEADDIRDSGNESFARIEALRFRSKALNIAAVVFLLMGAGVAVPAVMALFRRGRAEPGTERHPSRRSILGAVDAELAAVADQSRGGWTPELAARALNAVRVAGSCALRRDIAERPLNGTENAPLPGQLVVSQGVLRRRRIAISSAVTALDVEAAIASLPLTAPHQRRQVMEQLRDSMTAFTSRLYGAQFDASDAGFDEAVASVRAAAREVRRA